jgi:hypothetical protein
MSFISYRQDNEFPLRRSDTVNTYVKVTDNQTKLEIKSVLNSKEFYVRASVSAINEFH